MGTVAIHQPNYLPWSGYFHKMYNCDDFVFLDNVAFTKNSVQNRNMIKSASGKIWLTVPVLQKGNYGQMTNDVRINNAISWRKKHWNSIYMNYHASKFFSRYAEFFENIYSRDWEKLSAICLEIFNFLKGELEICADFHLSSELACEGSGTEHLINICKKLSASVYLSGIGGKKYLEEASFESSGIELKYQSFTHPSYSQLFGEFIPNLSIIDLLFNEGKEAIGIIKAS